MPVIVLILGAPNKTEPCMPRSHTTVQDTCTDNCKAPWRHTIDQLQAQLQLFSEGGNILNFVEMNTYFYLEVNSYILHIRVSKTSLFQLFMVWWRTKLFVFLFCFVHPKAPHAASLVGNTIKMSQQYQSAITIYVLIPSGPVTYSFLTSTSQQVQIWVPLT